VKNCDNNPVTITQYAIIFKGGVFTLMAATMKIDIILPVLQEFVQAFGSLGAGFLIC